MIVECRTARVVSTSSVGQDRHMGAGVALSFLLHEEGAEGPGLPGRRTERVSVTMDPAEDAGAVTRRLIEEALRQLLLYFDGEDDGTGKNLFAGIAPAATATLPPAAEAELQAELRAIETAFPAAG